MYIRTREGFREPTYSTLQTFSRPIPRSTLIDYLGNFDERMGEGESGPCRARFIVAEFRPGSHRLTIPIQKDMRNIAKNIARRLKLRLSRLKGKPADVELRLHSEGHVDSSTDPKNYGKLDDERAGEVGWRLGDMIAEEIKPFQARSSVLIKYTYSAAGPNRPISSTPKKNRRVEVCVRFSISPKP